VLLCGLGLRPSAGSVIGGASAADDLRQRPLGGALSTTRSTIPPAAGAPVLIVRKDEVDLLRRRGQEAQ